MFRNNYVHKTASKESACWVCGKFSSAVLTHHDIDWFYVCLNHIKDPAFCKPVNDGSEVASKAPTKQEGKGQEKLSKVEQKTNDIPAEEKSKEVHQKPVLSYVLDEKLFYMREAECRKRLQAKNAKQLQDRLPTVPGNRSQ